LRPTKTDTARCRRFHDITDQNRSYATPSPRIMTPQLDVGKRLRVKPQRAKPVQGGICSCYTQHLH
jgi:hypothetical protein